MNTNIPTPAVRLRRPERCQVEMQLLSFDQMLPPDLTPLLAQIRSTVDHAGHPAIDPRLLLALWLLATIHGVGSAREVARRCEEHMAYRWLCGGVSVNYHTLSDFRTGPADFLDRLLTQSVATLLHQDLIVLDRVAQDGMRVRASAGAASFRRPSTLKKCLAEAAAQVQTLKAQIEADPSASARRQERLAADRCARISRALREAAQLAEERPAQAKKSGRKVQEPRASTTDPEARRMKMADGGFRPAYNVQLATTTQGGIIAGVEVTNQGSDSGAMTPMVEQLERRYGIKPKEVLVDGGFAAVDAIQSLHAAHQVQVFAPVKDEAKQRAAGRDPFAPKRGDPEGVAQWRQRMGTEAAQQIYRERAQTAEWANAGMRNRGLYQFRVRGLAKVLRVTLWYAVAHNLLQAARLRSRR
jgi:transposase